MCIIHHSRGIQSSVEFRDAVFTSKFEAAIYGEQTGHVTQLQYLHVKHFRAKSFRNHKFCNAVYSSRIGMVPLHFLTCKLYIVRDPILFKLQSHLLDAAV